jgi:hypothetical protein
VLLTERADLAWRLHTVRPSCTISSSDASTDADAHTDAHA